MRVSRNQSSNVGHCFERPRCRFLPWEIYYGVKRSNNFQNIGYLGWAAADLCYCTVFILHGSQGRQWQTVRALFFSTIVYIISLGAFHHYLEADIDFMALYTALESQVHLSWASVWAVGFHNDLRGHSMEIW